MSKRVTIGLTFLALVLSLLATPVVAQETVTGFFEGLPATHNAGTGFLPLTGWALADSGVRRVVIKVDNQVVGQAQYGHFRPDVEAQFPGFPDSMGAGFTYNLNSTQFGNGTHTVTAEVLSFNGTTRVIQGVYDIFFNNNTSTLVPFGEISLPQRNADLFGTCSSTTTGRITTFVEGWALDLGVEPGDGGIGGGVYLMVDGSLVASSAGCLQIPGLGKVNCYGLPRPDIELQFPFAVDAPSAGWRFGIDIGYLISELGYSQGHHRLSVWVGDEETNRLIVDEIPVNFWCTSPNEGSIGFIEEPRPGLIVEGTTTFVGWAIDAEGIDQIEIRIDGIDVGDATYGVDSRPSVAVQYPGYPDSAAPVWNFVWDSTSRVDGFHQIEAYAIDIFGARTLVGERTFYVDNGID